MMASARRHRVPVSGAERYLPRPPVHPCELRDVSDRIKAGPGHGDLHVSGAGRGPRRAGSRSAHCDSSAEGIGRALPYVFDRAGSSIHPRSLRCSVPHAATRGPRSGEHLDGGGRDRLRDALAASWPVGDSLALARKDAALLEERAKRAVLDSVRRVTTDSVLRALGIPSGVSADSAVKLRRAATDTTTLRPARCPLAVRLAQRYGTITATPSHAIVVPTPSTACQTTASRRSPRGRRRREHPPPRVRQFE